jgi:hypothetical protein
MPHPDADTRRRMIDQLHQDTARLVAELDTPSADDRAETLAQDAARIAGGEYRPRYNGWTNIETWSTALWIDNEPSLYDDAREIVADAMALADAELWPHWTPDAEYRANYRATARTTHAAARLSDWYDEAIDPDDNHTAGPIADALGYALACINWREIAEHYADDLEPAP